MSGFVLFSTLFTSKNFKTAVGHSSKRQEEIFTLSRQALREQNAKRLPVAESPSLLQRIGNRHRRGSAPLANPLLCPSAPGAVPQPAGVTETNRPPSHRAPHRVCHRVQLPLRIGCSFYCVQQKARALLFRAEPGSRTEDRAPNALLRSDEQKFFSTI